MSSKWLNSNVYNGIVEFLGNLPNEPDGSSEVTGEVGLVSKLWRAGLALETSFLLSYPRLGILDKHCLLNNADLENGLFSGFCLIFAILRFSRASGRYWRPNRSHL